MSVTWFQRAAAANSAPSAWRLAQTGRVAASKGIIPQMWKSEPRLGREYAGDLLWESGSLKNTYLHN